jgi:hypothetical protein
VRDIGRDCDFVGYTTLSTQVEKFTPPRNALGADLLWWRTSDRLRTVATLLWGRVQYFNDDVHLQAFLFDAQGRHLTAWRIELQPDHPIRIDSASDGPWRQAQGSDGILVLYTCTAVEPSADARSRYDRLYPLLDWQLADGRIATLHSDQTICRNRDSVQEFTEIVILEHAGEKNALVLLNGEELQPENSLTLTFQNAHGETQAASYSAPMLPFTVHRIELAALLPGLAEFAGSHPLLVCGKFSSHGLFSRPYIETVGTRWGVYHAGDIYRWPELPYPAHVFIGGEVNPAAVMHDEQVRTYVNILHSQGTLEDDIAVDAALFDIDGTCVARRRPWHIAHRNGLARGEIAELLPDASQPFRGHIALNFAPAPGESVPGHLQALLEYRSAASVARVMTWSDEWNSFVHLAKRDRSIKPTQYRSWFRIWPDADATTEIAITNAGHDGYDRTADVRATYCDGAGKAIETNFLLAPHATRMGSMKEFFPNAIDALRSAPFGIILIESTSDLANVAYTHHHASGTIAAEHFVSLRSEHEGSIVLPAGS